MPGRPVKDNCGPVGHNFDGQKSRDILAEESTDSARQISRYIRLTELVPGLLDLVDENRIAFRPAVELSYLSEGEQKDLLETISYLDATPSLSQAQKMRELSKDGRLSYEAIEAILSEEKPNQREKITFRADRLRQYLPPGISPRQTEDYVLKALEYYQRYRERQRQQER